jgi:lipopolysaccharide cholinephosphotransferase
VGGIYIDIFPLDSVPNNRCLRTIQHYRFNICKRLLYLSYRNPYKHGHGPSSWAPLLVQKLFKRAQLHRLVQRVEYWWEGRSHCDYLTTYDDGLRVFPRHIFEEPVRMKFEGVEANAPADSKAFLQIMYGDDYMTPPPEGKRLSHRHDYCDFDTPYADYISSQSTNISKS